VLVRHVTLGLNCRLLPFETTRIVVKKKYWKYSYDKYRMYKIWQYGESIGNFRYKAHVPMANNFIWSKFTRDETLYVSQRFIK
jgi:hypothetical protein